ncbi:hypothetical protein CWI39_1641p0020 [Hamiltosporidium magnivora]|uniref:RING-type domain-containing protein n=1 Tax=Hamiltosporidium magnivora TaxID=148818 RepID=A0A4Q9KZU3_9MICR|nr:hypothetical protein CWI39_1641p0020 [Hamiltosporidium magnivora]
MNDKKILNVLIYCNICYKSYDNSKEEDSNLFISDCMHIVCKDCIEDIDFCKVCGKNNDFKLINQDLKKILTKNPTEMFIKPVDISMFQLSSSLNLILHLKYELNTYKDLLKRAKNELIRFKDAARSKNSKPGFLNINSNQPIQKNRNHISETVNKIYKKNFTIENQNNKTIQRNSPAKESKNILVDLTNGSKIGKRKRTSGFNTVSDLNINDASFSSASTSRLTLSTRKSIFKTPFSRNNRLF